MQRHQVDLALDPRSSPELLAEEAARWDGEWQADGDDGHAGRLALPVVAGLRHGWVAGRVTVEPIEVTGQGAEDATPLSHLLFCVEEADYRVQTRSVLVLTIAACGAIVFLLAPFVPVLRPAIPLGLIFCLGAWFVIAGLRNSGPEEFFETLAAQADEAAPE